MQCNLPSLDLRAIGFSTTTSLLTLAFPMFFTSCNYIILHLDIKKIILRSACALKIPLYLSAHKLPHLSKFDSTVSWLVCLQKLFYARVDMFDLCKKRMINSYFYFLNVIFIFVCMFFV